MAFTSFYTRCLSKQIHTSKTTVGPMRHLIQFGRCSMLHKAPWHFRNSLNLYLCKVAALPLSRRELKRKLQTAGDGLGQYPRKSDQTSPCMVKQRHDLNFPGPVRGDMGRGRKVKKKIKKSKWAVKNFLSSGLVLYPDSLAIHPSSLPFPILLHFLSLSLLISSVARRVPVIVGQLHQLVDNIQ